MGCCAKNAKFQLELPFDQMEEYDKLKSEIEQFLSSEMPQEKKDKNKISNLLIKLSNQITRYENDLLKLKRDKDKTNNENINDDLIEGINQDIKILKEYQTSLNNMLNTDTNVIINENQIFINDNNNIIIDNKNNINEINNNDNNEIYFKKCIRRNKKGILNQKSNLNDNNINNNENDKKMELIDTNDYLHLDQNNNINIIFEFEDGKKVGLLTNKEEKFSEVITRLYENENENDILMKYQFFDGDNNINEKINNGEKVQEFNLNDFHVIKVKSENPN